MSAPGRSFFARWKALSLTSRIVAGLLTGAALGIFLAKRPGYCSQ